MGTESVEGFSMSLAMLSATLTADVFTDSRARWAYRAVVCTCRALSRMCVEQLELVVYLIDTNAGYPCPKQLTN